MTVTPSKSRAHAPEPRRGGGDPGAGPASPEPVAQRFARYRRALAGERLPCALVDLDAFDQNLADLLAGAQRHGKPIRLASKSIRCRALIRRALERGGEQICGVMGFTVEEAAFLVEDGVRDVLVAYPTAQPRDAALLRQLNQRPHTRVSVVVDAPEQLDVLAAAPGEAEIPVVIEVDMSWRLGGGRVHLGVRRSPLYHIEDVLRVARAVRQRQGLRLVGLMGYEAQVAGLTDRNPFTRAVNPFKGVIRRRSVTLARRRRQALAEALRAEGFGLDLFNGGGTGSVDTTSTEEVVTEVAAGSGLLMGHLFDYYSNVSLRPAAHFAVQVVRKPAPGFVTCHGGGYVASGEIGLDRLPIPVDPPGLRRLSMEGAGEVQTPLRVPPGTELALGDAVFFRHAKSGELAEHFNTYLLIAGEQVVDRVPTYRGEGQAFL